MRWSARHLFLTPPTADTATLSQVVVGTVALYTLLEDVVSIAGDS
ncbi:hypothetical protein [Haloarcula sp. S1AR25-4]|nr:hypothetical protein [Halomicroarcula sp. S1AR25-4]